MFMIFFLFSNHEKISKKVGLKGPTVWSRRLQLSAGARKKPPVWGLNFLVSIENIWQTRPQFDNHESGQVDKLTVRGKSLCWSFQSGNSCLSCYQLSCIDCVLLWRFLFAYYWFTVWLIINSIIFRHNCNTWIRFFYLWRESPPNSSHIVRPLPPLHFFEHCIY